MGSSSNHSLPSKSEVENQHKANISQTAGKPSFTPNNPNDNNQDMAPPPLNGQNQIRQHPIDEIFDTPSEKVKDNNNNNKPTPVRQNNSQPQPQLRSQPQGQLPQPQQNASNANNPQPQIQMGVASPYVQPVGVPFGNPYYPGQPMYPYPYYGPQPPVNTVVVLPPGYKPDNSPGYCPWGNLGEDLRTLF